MRTCFIDWTENDLHLYSFEKKKGQFILSDITTVPIEGELSQSTLSSVIRSHYEHIFLSIPANKLSLRELSFPFHDKTKIKDTISYELEGVLLENTGNYSIDHIVAEKTENESIVLAVCIEKKRLREIIDTFSSIGLEPRIVTSLDIRLSGGKSDSIFDNIVVEKEVRAQAAKEELSSPTLNLRQDELSYVKDVERITKTIQLSFLLIFILLLIVGTNTTLRFVSLKEGHTLLKKEIHNVYRKAFPEDKKIIDPVRQFKGNLGKLVEKRSVLAGIPALDTLRSIANLKNNSITLHEFNSGEKNILIKGIAASFEEVESFKDTLPSSFDDVRVTDSNASSDEKIIFSIVMKEKRL